MRFWDGSWCFLKCGCVSFLSLLGCEDHISKPHIMIILLIQTFLKRIFTLFTISSNPCQLVLINLFSLMRMFSKYILKMWIIFLTCHDICLVFIYVLINISEHDNQNRLVLVRKENVTNDMKFCKFLFWSLVAFWCSLLYITSEYSFRNINFLVDIIHNYWLVRYLLHLTIDDPEQHKMSWAGILKPDHNYRSCSY